MEIASSIELPNSYLALVTVQSHGMTKPHSINDLHNIRELLRVSLDVGHVDMMLRSELHG